MEIRADFETRSAVNLKTRGQGAYFACPQFMPLLLRFQMPEETAIRGWRYTDRECPPGLYIAIKAGWKIRAFNAAFERQCFDWLADNWGWPRPAIEQYICTAAEAAAMALPRNLEDCAKALDITEQKSKEGSDLIKFFSNPRRPKKGEDPNGVYFNDPTEFTEKFDAFDQYCAQDVRAESGVCDRIFRLSAFEQRLYTIDQRINARGLRIDTTSARASVRLADRAKRGFDRSIRELTHGHVTACTQTAKIKEWVLAQGVALASVGKADLEDMLELDDLPDNIRQVLLLRQEAGKTTVSKLNAFLARVSPDDRLRNSFLFNAAGTTRWSSTGAQVHNLARPRKEFSDAHLATDVLYETFRFESPEFVEFSYGPKLGSTLHLISDAVRGFIWAAPGNELIAVDYSGIEGVVAAWLAGETWKLQAFFDILADPSQPDIYRQAAARIYNCAVELLTKKDPRRQIGKVSELSLQYQGGVGAFRSMARNYLMKLEPAFAPVWEASDAERRDKVTRRYASCCVRKEATTQVMSKEAWIAADLIKVGWRAGHPKIVAAWKDLENAARQAVISPGQKFTAAKATYLVANGFLWCQLPGGTLCYGAPRLKAQVWAKMLQENSEWGDAEVVERDRAQRLEVLGKCRIQGDTSAKVTVLGVDSISKQWVRYGLYGGLLMENNTQKTARDLLANGIVIAEEANYPVVGHVHDEIIAEIPRGWGDLAWLEKAVCKLPNWGEGIPLSASGWRGKRYRK